MRDRRETHEERLKRHNQKRALKGEYIHEATDPDGNLVVEEIPAEYNEWFRNDGFGRVPNSVHALRHSMRPLVWFALVEICMKAASSKYNDINVGQFRMSEQEMADAVGKKSPETGRALFEVHRRAGMIERRRGTGRPGIASVWTFKPQFVDQIQAMKVYQEDREESRVAARRARGKVGSIT